MNIKEAADFLGISVRAIERHVKAKKIAVTYIDNKRDFTEAELTRFKSQKQQPVHRPAIATTQSDTALSQAVAPEYLSEGLEYLEVVASASYAIACYYQFKHLRSQMLLSLSEAATVSRLSVNYLRANLITGNLKGKKLGRGWKIRPHDLEDFINDIFKKNPVYLKTEVQTPED